MPLAQGWRDFLTVSGGFYRATQGTATPPIGHMSCCGRGGGDREWCFVFGPRAAANIWRSMPEGAEKTYLGQQA